MRRSSWTSFVISTLLLAGCAVGPNYKRPQVAVPRQWTVAAARGTAATPIEKDDWWSSFQDPELNSLVERSAKQNLDLKLALERIQEARAARGVVRSGYFPSINGAASATRNRQRIIVPAGPQKSAVIVPVEYNNFSGRLCRLMGNGCLRSNSSERAGCHCRHDRCGRESPRRAHHSAGRCRPRVCATTGFPAPARDCKQEYQNAARDS